MARERVGQSTRDEGRNRDAESDPRCHASDDAPVHRAVDVMRAYARGGSEQHARHRGAESEMQHVLAAQTAGAEQEHQHRHLDKTPADAEQAGE